MLLQTLEDFQKNAFVSFLNIHFVYVYVHAGVYMSTHVEARSSGVCLSQLPFLPYFFNLIYNFCGD